MRWAFENTSEMQKTRAVGGCFLHFSGVLRCPEAREVQNIVIQIKAPFMQRVPVFGDASLIPDWEYVCLEIQNSYGGRLTYPLSYLVIILSKLKETKALSMKMNNGLSRDSKGILRL